MADFALNLRSAVQMARGGGAPFDLRNPKNRPATSTATSPVSKHSPASAVYGKTKRHMMEEIGHELKEHPPKIVAHTKRKFGAKRAAKQTTAILLAKARRRGAK